MFPAQKKFKSRYMNYKRYMRWVEYCRDCKARGVNPFSNKGCDLMAAAMLLAKILVF